MSSLNGFMLAKCRRAGCLGPWWLCRPLSIYVYMPAWQLVYIPTGVRYLPCPTHLCLLICRCNTTQGILPYVVSASFYEQASTYFTGATEYCFTTSVLPASQVLPVRTASYFNCAGSGSVCVVTQSHLWGRVVKQSLFVTRVDRGII